MFIDHRGSNENTSRAEIEYALEWYLKRLLGPRLTARLHVKLHHIIFEIKNDRGSAFPYFTDDNKKPRKFLIELSKEIKRTSLLLRILAHEVVHLKQFVLGEMFDCPKVEGVVRWRKRRIVEKEHAYRDLPWEKEAFRLERSLYAAYKRHKEKENLTF
jgi:hypothetical protein